MGLDCDNEKVCWRLTAEDKHYQLDFTLKKNTLDRSQHYQLSSIKQVIE
jgi:hypothetical protein